MMENNTLETVSRRKQYNEKSMKKQREVKTVLSR